MKKVEDFGSHYEEYYQLNVSYFKTSTDKRLLNQLWKQYWVAILSSSSWLKNLGYNIEKTQDIAAEMTETLAEARRENFGYGNGGKLTNGEVSCNLKKAVRDGEKLSNKVCMAKKKTNIASGETFKVELTTAKCISAGLPDKFHHSTIDEFLRSSYTS